MTWNPSSRSSASWIAIGAADKKVKIERLSEYDLPGEGLVVTMGKQMFEFQVWRTNPESIERGKKHAQRVNAIKKRRGLSVAGGQKKAEYE